jgi:hypothetical protein
LASYGGKCFLFAIVDRNAHDNDDELDTKHEQKNVVPPSDIKQLVKTVVQGDSLSFGIVDKLEPKHLWFSATDTDCLICHVDLKTKEFLDFHNNSLAGKMSHAYQYGGGTYCWVCNHDVPRALTETHYKSSVHIKHQNWVILNGYKPKPQNGEQMAALGSMLERYTWFLAIGSLVAVLVALIIIWLICKILLSDDKATVVAEESGFWSYFPSWVNTEGKKSWRSKGKNKHRVNIRSTSDKSNAKRKTLDIIRTYAGDVLDAAQEGDEVMYADTAGNRFSFTCEKGFKQKMQDLLNSNQDFDDFFDRSVDDISGAISVWRNGNLVSRSQYSIDLNDLESISLIELDDKQVESLSAMVLATTMIKATASGAGMQLGKAIIDELLSEDKTNYAFKKECAHHNCPKGLATKSGDVCNTSCGGHHCTHWLTCKPAAWKEKKKDVKESLNCGNFCVSVAFGNKCKLSKCQASHDILKAKSYFGNIKCTRTGCLITPKRGDVGICLLKHEKMVMKEQKKESMGSRSRVTMQKMVELSSAVGNVMVNGHFTSHAFCSRNMVMFVNHPIPMLSIKKDAKVSITFGDENERYELKLTQDEVLEIANDLREKCVKLKFVAHDLATSWYGVQRLPPNVKCLTLATARPNMGARLFHLSNANKRYGEESLAYGTVTGVSATTVSYDIPTDEGDCGSPVFLEGSFQVVAVHASGDVSGGGRTNEGISAHLFQ